MASALHSGAPMHKHTALLLALSAAGCSSADFEITPWLLEPSIAVDTSRPDELATIDFRMTFQFEEEVERVVALGQVALIDADDESAEHVPIELAFPDDFDGRVSPDEAPTLELVNAGATNAELERFCGATLRAFAVIDYSDEDGTSYAAAHPPVTASITCR